MLAAGLLVTFGLHRVGNLDAPVESQEFDGATMGTTYSARFHWRPAQGPSPPIRQELIDERLAGINRRMSTYDPESELSRFNASGSTEWFEVSGETAKVVAYALELAEDSAGAYDPTVGPVVNLWGFGPDKRREAPPTENEIAAAREDVGWRLVEARLDPPALRKSRPGVYVDLSSIAKGFGSDAVSELLDRRHAYDSMVEIGGEVMCRGAKPDGSPWRIGVRRPSLASGGLAQSVVELRDEALATSGDYANFFEVDGVRYSHTIDPATGRPVTHETASVSVRAKTCMKADALATTLLVMGSDTGYNWAVDRGVAALFIDRADNAFTDKATPAWDAVAEP